MKKTNRVFSVVGKVVKYFLWMVPVTLVMLELAVRLWGYSEHYLYDPIYMPYLQAEEIPYIHKPGLNNVKARGEVQLYTDRLGLRSSEGSRKEYPVKTENEIRIAIAGDSLTFGEGIENNADTYCSVLERFLNQRTLDNSRYRVFNFGASAYSVKEMAYTLKYRMLEVNPDVVIMSIFPADFTLERTGKLNMYGYTDSRDAKEITGMAGDLKVLIRKIRLVYLLRDLYYGWRFKSEPLNRLEQQIPASYKYVLEFKKFAVDNNLNFLVVLLPSLQRDFNQEIIKQLRADNVNFLDLQYVKNEFEPEEYKSFVWDSHPSEAVHKRLGEELGKYFTRQYALTGADQ